MNLLPTRAKPLPTDPRELVGAPLVPGINILPGTVAERLSLRRLKVMLAAALGAVGLVLVGAMGIAILDRSSAESDLAQLELEQQALRADQVRFREVVDVRRELTRTANALVASMSYEVEWVPVITAIFGILPEDGIITSLTLDAMGPGRPAMNNPNVLSLPSIGYINFTVNVKTLPDAAQWIDSLSAIPGFMDATYTSAQLLTVSATLQDQETLETETLLEDYSYVVTSSVQLNVGALSGDFVEVPDSPGAQSTPTTPPGDATALPDGADDAEGAEGAQEEES
jgi:Tfp pilus assembly protein PilN